MEDNLWIRCGDQDDYNKFDTLQDAADYLAMMDCFRPVVRQGESMGLSDGVYYKNQNYISIYWGGKTADVVGRDVTDDEITAINVLLEENGASHEHQWGPLERSRLAGTVHRKCQVPGCKEISLDAVDDDSDSDDND